MTLDPSPQTGQEPLGEIDPPEAPIGRIDPPMSYIIVRATMLTVAAVCLGLVLYLFVIGSVEHSVAQSAQYSRFRNLVALGTAPTGQVDGKNRLVPAGTPVALLQIKRIGLSEVVGEGTTSETLTSGPGHLRSTVLPGQPGVSVIMGRQWAFGGPFSDIDKLRKGDVIQVTVGFGSNVEKFKVLDVRRKGSALPPPVADGGSRLVLVTATGLPLMPSGVVYVDADLVGQTQPASTLVITSPIKSEQPGQGDYSTLWALALWLMGLFVALAGAVWSWYRWSRVHTYIVFSPVLLLVGYWVADQVARVLPNLL